MNPSRYREVPAPSGAGLACAWSQELSRDADGPFEQLVVPDGCIDLIWWAGEGKIQVAGPDTRSNLAGLKPGDRLIAVRFRPGMAAPTLGVPADAVRDGRLPLRDLWGDAADRLGDLLTASADPQAALTAAVLNRTSASGPVDPIARPLVTALAEGTVREAAHSLGLGERQLRRRTMAAFGYSPKTLQRVLRFQRALKLARAGHPFADVAYETGYTDQAHLAHEVRDLAGTPLTGLV
ncbi:helix-turn-helix domain-containing protein [Actinomadura barringtoniae]|uniref:Helix-turn-helix domain-containing protein n=1 Tax=Actinomadura barringtoniae TaxID=1427535 RepID=A0A939PCA3_9ACTN|nr:helix-turn-helix domain-containing protein [Actinomadura barringtoniae]MBO2449758.1 helix-turn-helix domain-containing protein [Actinomadura barringtoniae]